MCGRYTNRFTWSDIHDALSAVLVDVDWRDLPSEDPRPRYNLAPTQQAPIVIAHDGALEGLMARWDFVPFFFKQPLETKKWTSINAKVEEITAKPAFRGAVKTQRCLVPSNGFIEWKRVGDAKQPFLIAPTDTPISFMAGVWDRWKGIHKGEEKAFVSFAILTCEPNALVSPIHDRMPVIVRAEDYRTWLLGAPADALKIAGPYPAQVMSSVAIDAAVGSVKNDYPALLESA